MPVRAGAASGHGHAVEPPNPPKGGLSFSARCPASRRHIFSNCFGRILRSLAASPRPHPPMRPPRGPPSNQGARPTARASLRAEQGRRGRCCAFAAPWPLRCAGLLRYTLAIHLLASGRCRLSSLRSAGSRRSVSRGAAHSRAAVTGPTGLGCACVRRGSGRAAARPQLAAPASLPRPLPENKTAISPPVRLSLAYRLPSASNLPKQERPNAEGPCPSAPQKDRLQPASVRGLQSQTWRR